MSTTGDNLDLTRAAVLAAWLREQPIARRARTVLLHDLQLISGERAAAGEESLLRGLDPDTFAIQLHLPDGGVIARVAGIGDKTLAALRQAIPAPASPQQRDCAGADGATASDAPPCVPVSAPEIVASPHPTSPPIREPEEPEEPAPTPPMPRALTPGSPSAPAPEPVTANGSSSEPNDTLAVLTRVAAGLLVPSESDYPFAPVRWEGSGPLTPAALLDYLELPPNTPVETRTLEAFFAPLTRNADWMDAAQRAQAVRFAELRDLIAARLHNVVVYRVGRVQITVVVVGQDTAEATVGLRTTLIET